MSGWALVPGGLCSNDCFIERPKEAVAIIVFVRLPRMVSYPPVLRGLIWHLASGEPRQISLHKVPLHAQDLLFNMAPICPLLCLMPLGPDPLWFDVFRDYSSHRAKYGGKHSVHASCFRTPYSLLQVSVMFAFLNQLPCPPSPRRPSPLSSLIFIQ